MIKWRNITEVGKPTDSNKKYLVTDGTDMSVSGIYGITNYRDNVKPTFIFKGWSGDENTYEDNGCCSGSKVFDMTPTHWCPIDELNLPNKL